jgi:hypothetical protein
MCLKIQVNIRYSCGKSDFTVNYAYCEKAQQRAGSGECGRSHLCEKLEEEVESTDTMRMCRLGCDGKNH